jgi:hypothetical protein
VRLKARLQDVLTVALAAASCACASPVALVSEQTYAPPGTALERVAVIPFYAHQSYEGSLRLGGVPAEVASEQIARFVAEALAERGVYVIDPEDVAAAIEDVPRLTMAVDALVFAEIASRELGATGVLLGEVLRYRNTLGVTPAARRPASVAYQMSLFETPDGYKVWSARFDESQRVDVDSEVAELPGFWLSAADIARRGAVTVARSLDAQR